MYNFMKYASKPNPSAFVITIAIALFWSLGLSAVPIGLRIELIEHPDISNPDTKVYKHWNANRVRTVAVEDSRPEYSWIVPAASTNVYQSAYQILVASSLSNASNNIGDVWNSGNVESDHSVAVSHAGAELKALTDYYWKVRVQTTEGWSSYSEVQHFKTGSLKSEYATTRYPIVESPIKARGFEKTGSSEWFYDFGQAYFGQAQINIPSLAGQSVTVTLIENNNPAQKGVNWHFSQTVLLDVEGKAIVPAKNTLTNNYSIGPFRHARISAQATNLDVNSVIQLAHHYPFDDSSSSFSSSDELLNKIWILCKYTQKATSAYGVYIDGFREILPYEGDAYVNMQSHFAVDNEYSLGRLSHEHLMDHPTWPLEYKIQSVYLAWFDYLYTGDTESLAHFYTKLTQKTLEQFVDRTDGLLTKQKSGQRTGPMVDWASGTNTSSQSNGTTVIANAFYYRSLVLMQKIADALGKSAESNRYKVMAEQVYTSVYKVHYNTEKRLFRDSDISSIISDYGNAYPLALGLTKPEDFAFASAFLEPRGMFPGVYGAQFLIDGLYRAERGDLAYLRLTAKGSRSWNQMLERSATITYESWEVNGTNDINHAWGSAPGNLIPRGIFGISPLEPAWRKIQIKPQPYTIRTGIYRQPTIRGDVTVQFTNTPNSQLELKVTIPGNTQAEVWLPAYGNKVMVNGSVVEGTRQGNFIVIDKIGSGTHSFVSRRGDLGSPMRLDSARCSLLPNEVYCYFSHPVKSESIKDITQFILTPNVSIDTCIVMNDPTIVKVVTSKALSKGTQYTLTMKNIEAASYTGISNKVSTTANFTASYSLAAYWNFENIASDGRVADWSGEGNDGTLKGKWSVNDTQQVGTALVLNGQGWMEAPFKNSLSLSNYTVSLDFYMSQGFPTWDSWGLVSTEGAGANTFQSAILDKRLLSQIGDGKSWIGSDSGLFLDATAKTERLPIGEWHNIQFVVANKEAKVYINGNFWGRVELSKSPVFMVAGQTLRLGKYGSSQLKGNLDHCAIFPRALADAELSLLANASLQKVSKEIPVGLKNLSLANKALLCNYKDRAFFLSKSVQSIQFYNSQGKLVYHLKSPAAGAHEITLSPGLYYVRVRENDLQESVMSIPVMAH